VSWNNFQQPRWAATDKPNIQKVVEDAGGKYIDKDANLSTEQQLTDVDTLISQGAKVLILLAQDTTVVGPALQKAKDAGIPVIAYDRLIEDPSVLYITFDNKGVGKAEADAILAKVPKGNYVLIKGDPGDPNAKTFLPAGWDEAGLKAKVDSGDIKLLNGPDGTYTDAWKTEKAQANMEAIIDKANSSGTKIEAVLAENHSTALASRSALQGQYGSCPVRPGRRPRQPEQRRARQRARRHLEEQQRAGARRRPGCALALQQPDFSEIAVNSTRRSRRGRQPADFTTPGGKTVVDHPQAHADHRRQARRRDGQGLVCHQGPDLQGCQGRRSGRDSLQVTVSTPLEASACLRPGFPRGAGRFQPKTRRVGGDERGWRDTCTWSGPQPPARTSIRGSSPRRRSISVCSACWSP
jgi:hypothetical protein